jgi:hypothetical protein
LRREEGNEIFEGGPEGGRGHFWGIHETREYMRARFALVESLNKVNTQLAVQESLDTLLDMLQLCRSDNMGVRDLVPAMFLRLGMHHECYGECPAFLSAIRHIWNSEAMFAHRLQATLSLV